LPFHRQDARQAHDPQLGRGVVGLADVADQAAGRGEVDVAAFLLVAEQLHRGAGDVVGAAKVHLDDLVPVLVIHLVEHLVAQDAGRIDDRVQAAEGVLGLLDHTPDGGHGGDAVGVGHGFAAGGLDFVGRLLGRTCVAFVTAADAAAQVVDDDLGALARRQQGALLADAAGGAGDQNNLALKYAHGGSPLDDFCEFPEV
jgi:hypothetical protein